MNVGDWARQAVADEIPFLRKGRTRAGLDCWGLVRLLYSEVYGAELPDYGELYEPGDVYKADVVEGLIEPRLGTWDRVEKGDELAGDGIFICGRGIFPHVGVVVRSGEMVHIEDGILVSVVPYRNGIWWPSIREFRRYRPPGR